MFQAFRLNDIRIICFADDSAHTFSSIIGRLVYVPPSYGKSLQSKTMGKLQKDSRFLLDLCPVNFGKKPAKKNWLVL